MHQRQIKLYFSHSVEHLADRLNHQLSLQRQNSSNILNPAEVIVPNGNMQKYLQLNMASRDGICANVAFPFLETGLFQATLKLQNKAAVRMLNQGDLALKIWHKLADSDDLDPKVYQPIQHYFSSEESAALQSKKHWQLSQRLALLMMDYELKRPEMVQAWLTGGLIFESSQDERLRALEVMQKDLYLSLMNAQQLQSDGAENEVQQLTLFQLWQQADWSQVSVPDKATAIHIFTPTRLSQFHRQLLCDLARSYEIHIYQLNVCAEYWQDMQTEGEDIWHQRLLAQKVSATDSSGEPISNDTSDIEVAESFFEMDDALIENPLLKAWGKPGREALKLYSELEEDAIHFDVSFSDEWLDSEQRREDTLLHLLQDAILFRSQGDKELTQPNQLASLQITQAPSIYREVESVYHNILWHLKQDETLEPSDVALLVTDMDKYRFVIEQVFGELNRQQGVHLNYALVDASVTVESSYARAVLSLFDFLANDFMRAEVFQWLRNPCVMSALQLTDGDWDDWLQTASQLGIFAGFEQLYQAVDEATEDNDDLGKRFTWSQGLRRLHVYLANETTEHSLLDADGIGKLSVLLDYLHHQHQLLTQARSAQAWEALLSRLFDTLLAIPETLPREQSVQMALSQSLLKLSKQVPDMTLNFHDVRNFIEAELNDLSASKGHYLTGGVVCAALQPMRPIPFKITYVLGLDAPSFPGGLRFDTLDLSNRSRRIGDINQIENKQYLFLETLMCSREKLYLSYVGEDLRKAEQIERSSVLDELADFAMTFIDEAQMGQSLAVPSNAPLAAFPETKLPLDSKNSAPFRFDDSSFADMSVNFSLADHYLAWAETAPMQAQVHAKAHAKDMLVQGDRQQQAAAQQFLDLFEASDGSEVGAVTAKDNETKNSKVDVKADIKVDIGDLAKYLENAMSEVLLRQGMVSKHPDQEALVEHEPFELNGLDKHILYQQAVWDVVNAADTLSLAGSLRAKYQQMAAQSTLPVEFFVDIDELSEVAEEPSYQSMMKDLSELTACSGPLVFGEAVTDATPVQSTSAISIPLPDGRNIQLHGVVDGLFLAGETYQAQLVVSGGKIKAIKSDTLWDKKLIRPFLNWCLMQLSTDVKTAENMMLHLFYADHCHTKTLQFWATDEVSFSGPAYVRQYLADVLQDYLALDGTFINCEQVNQAKMPRTDELTTQIPYLPAKSKAKTVHPFNYQIADIDPYTIAAIQSTYKDKAQFKDYEEIAKIVELKTFDDVLPVMHKRYWPLHAMMLAQLPDETFLVNKDKEVK
ncbi:exodeoxyribonuclease V subunit gamma [Marinicella rhabdoformis]|uniref:exodeoxyribonuclease V subunit gamma n=1 Tax=Marinicella rhabdoformis TaxID=2580566 RepID=UPI0012AED08B|nr:exodeoxyribonuclease V subunit gamma [Marinicella rhabdoformis]